MRKECSDARKSFKKLASRTGKGHFVREGHTDARKSGEKLASRKLMHRRYITGGRERREGGERVGRRRRGGRGGEEEVNSVGREDGGRIKERKDIF